MKNPHPDNAPPPEAWPKARNTAIALSTPIERFFRLEAASGILLVLSASIAMMVANSPWAVSFHHFLELPVSFEVGRFRLEQTIHFLVNEVLMTVFFLVVGLEIRREVASGELSTKKAAALPIAAAVGGMVVPALIYLSIAGQIVQARSGWGVPMATDIAFAVGIFALLGNRVPSSLRVFLLALAIIDDIGAIIVIAIFYSSGIEIPGLMVCLFSVVSIIGLQRLGVRRLIIYVPLGALAWVGLSSSHVHPTITGVILGLLTPTRSWLTGRSFARVARETVTKVDQATDGEVARMVEPLANVRLAGREAVPPDIRLQSMLHPFVAYFVMPVFALANAGVTVNDVELTNSQETLVFAGIILGLAVGKPLGIVGASLLARKLGLCTFPKALSVKSLVVVGFVSGIGFTMALFMAPLGLSDSGILDAARLAVLLGSAVAAFFGLLLGRLFLSPSNRSGVANRHLDQ